MLLFWCPISDLKPMKYCEFEATFRHLNSCRCIFYKGEQRLVQFHLQLPCPVLSEVRPARLMRRRCDDKCVNNSSRPFRLCWQGLLISGPGSTGCASSYWYDSKLQTDTFKLLPVNDVDLCYLTFDLCTTSILSAWKPRPISHCFDKRLLDVMTCDQSHAGNRLRI